MPTAKSKQGEADKPKVTGKPSPELEHLAAEEKRLCGEGPPEADQQPESEGEPELTAADVIEPSRTYGVETIELTLSIQPWITRRAVVNGCVKGTRDARHPSIAGWALLDWIEKDRVPYTVTKGARTLYRLKRQRLQELADAKTEGPKTIVDQAAEVIESQTRHEAEDEETWARDEWGKYIALLLRADEPAETDAANLAGFMRNLGIAAGEVKRDLEIVRRAQELAPQHDDREQAKAASVKASEGYKALVSRHELEEKQAQKVKGTANHRMRLSYAAAGTLAQLAKERPRLFDLSVEPPRVRRPELK